MKKIILTMLLGVFIIFGLTACVSDTENSNTQTSFALNETAVYKDVHYTVTNVEYSNGSEWDKPAAGKHFVIITIKIENKSDSKIAYNVFDWKMINSQGQEDGGTFTTIDSDTNLSSGDLAPGGTKTGTIVFEQAQDESSLKLLFYSSLFNTDPSFEIIIK